MKALFFGDALLLVDSGENGVVGELEARDEIGGENFAPERIGTRLEHGPEAAVGVDGAEGAEGFANCRGVVGEVFNDGDAINFRADLKAALDALEGGERFDD